MEGLNWIWVGLGAGLGVACSLGLVFIFGRRFFKGMELEDRGPWDRPLARPFPKDQVVVEYKRRKRYHRHHRHHYERGRTSPPEADQSGR